MDPPPAVDRPHLDTTQLQPLASSSSSSTPSPVSPSDQDHDLAPLHPLDPLDSDDPDDDDQLDPSSSSLSPQAQRERRRRMRRMYGGGRHRHSGAHAHGGGASGGGGGDDDDDTESVAAEDEEGEGEGAVKAGQQGGVGEVAGMVLAASLSPFPLLLPLACTQLGPPLFVPLLALASALAWLGGVVIGVEGRYVGARSFPGLASGVFPHRFKLHKAGEFLAASFVLGASIVRTALGVVATAEIVVDVVVPERRRRDWERGVAVGLVCATWLLVPLVLPPLLSLLGLSPSRRHHPSSSSASYARLSSTSSPDLALAPGSPAFSAGPSPERPRWTALLRLPSWSVALLTWPVALLVLGVRMRRLNRDALSASPPLSLSLDPAASTAHLDLPLLSPSDKLGSSLWPAILVTVAAPLSASHEAFYYLSSLARPSSTASRGAEPGWSRGGGAFSLTGGGGGGGGGGGAGADEQAGTAGAGAAGAGAGARARTGGAEREGKRNQYPLSLLVGHLGSFLLLLGWALVGALSLPSSPLHPSPSPSPSPLLPPAPNLLTDARLPRSDPPLLLVRLLVLAALVAQLDAHAAVAIGRARRAIRPLGRSAAGARALRRAGARAAVWCAVAALAAVMVVVPALGRAAPGGGEGRHPRGRGEGMRRAGEWCGVLLGGVGGCLVPTIAYLVLFHLRRPRSILLPPSTTFPSRSSSSSSESGTDALLARKERQMQRRLSGRRVWLDAGVFGLLGPVGVLLVRLRSILRRAHHGGSPRLDGFCASYCLWRECGHGQLPLTPSGGATTSSCSWCLAAVEVETAATRRADHQRGRVIKAYKKLYDELEHAQERRDSIHVVDEMAAKLARLGTTQLKDYVAALTEVGEAKSNEDVVFWCASRASISHACRAPRG
ncbi:hypothetical protein DMC30DRAFT_452611 [Rhodotorula diobovata]|uniref:Uncharacterized protein n=1 Tax=Rhodotorula diobovata TaxID=5288 RepID=A0A5C5FLS0_9BASI|nr:hypothetical protein DMC30DRAFT_452611 [Rhodotorula diobovata]